MITTTQAQAMRSTVKPYDMHVLVASGPSCSWPSKIYGGEREDTYVANVVKVPTAIL